MGRDKDTWEAHLSRLKTLHGIYKTAESRSDHAKKILETKRNESEIYLEVMKKATFIDPKDGFKVAKRAYLNVVITDKRAFFGWLKKNCTPDEIINFLCPPTTKSDLKKFVEHQYAKVGPILEIDGLNHKVTYIAIKTSYPNEEKK